MTPTAITSTVSETTNVKPALNDTRIGVTYFKSYTTTAGSFEQVTTSDFFNVLRTVERTPCSCHKHREKKCPHKMKMPLFALYSLKPGATRADSNVSTFYGLAFDLDRITESQLVHVRTVISKYRSVMLSTHNHSVSNISFRAVIPFASPLPASAFPGVFDSFVTENNLPVDPSNKDMHRPYFLPSQPVDAEVVFEEYDGPLLDWSSIKPNYAHTTKKEKRTAARLALATTVPVTPELAAVVTERLKEHGPAIEGKAGDKHTYVAAAILRNDFGLNIEQSLPFFKTWNESCDPPWSESELIEKLENGERYSTGEKGTLLNQAPQASICLSRREKEDNDKAIAVLAHYPNLFQRGGRLVKVCVSSDVASSGYGDEATIREIDQATIRENLTDCVRFLKKVKTDNGFKEIEVAPPHHLITAIHARGEWPNVRRLHGLARHPTVRADGTIRAESGYDERTGLYHTHATMLLEIPEKPSVDEVNNARVELENVFGDFPFEDVAHRAVALSAIITPLVRPAFKGAVPLHLIDASTRGSGKTLLARCAAHIVLGESPTVMANTNNDEEMRKRITAIARSGASMVVLDNIIEGFGTPALDAALTSDTWTDRLLGKSESVTLPMQAMWFGTGNNVVVKGDMARRMVVCRLVPNAENPECRNSFKRQNLAAWVLEHRRTLLKHALTIARGYFAHGAPKTALGAMGSYEGWELVRQILVFSGAKDPVDTIAEYSLQSDTDRELFVEMIEAFKTIDPSNNGLTSLELAKWADRGTTTNEPGHELRQILARRYSGRNSANVPHDPKLIGNLLKKYKDRVVNGERLTTRKAGQNRTIWYVQKCGVNEVIQGESLSAVKKSSTESETRIAQDKVSQNRLTSLTSLTFGASESATATPAPQQTAAASSSTPPDTRSDAFDDTQDGYTELLGECE